MQLNQGLGGISIAATVSALIAQPAWAAPTEVTAVRLNRSASGVEVVLDTQGNNRPQVFTVNKGNSSVADITNTLLRLPKGNSFRQDKPAPGITLVTVNQIDTNTIRVVVSGTTKAPTGQVLRRNGPGLVLGFGLAPANEANSVPPALPRAVAPPVGDIAVAPVDATPDAIDLGTSERVTKMLLREAPVQEALTLLTDAAGLNLIYVTPEGKAVVPAKSPTTRTVTQTRGNTTESVTTSEKVEPPKPVEKGEITISLDIENEPVQQVFNYILRVAGLQANRVDQTIFVGRTLPGDAQNRIVRTYRLNQIKATASGSVTQTSSTTAETGGTTKGIGDSSSSSSSSGSDSSGSSSGGSSTATAETTAQRTTETTEAVNTQGAKEILESYGANGGGAGSTGSGGTSEAGGGSRSTLLRDLEVIADGRANSVTLIGSPRVVEVATSLLRQMDLRRRQAAVSVKIVDVDLTKGRNANASLQYGAGVGSGNAVTASFLGGNFQIGAPIGADFLLNLLGRIRDDDAKILTSPTLMVQEGSSAQVNLVQEVFSGIRRIVTATSPTGALPEITEEPIIRPAGVILNITVDRIDDNGFITMNISPTVSAPSGTFVVGDTEGTLLRQRLLESGQIRLRDGQTLILTGIIQDEDRIGVNKVPILGDIPLLGRLFRQETRTRSRRELVIVVTPRIQNDSDQPSFGYEYKPSPEAEKMLNPQGQ